MQPATGGDQRPRQPCRSFKPVCILAASPLLSIPDASSRCFGTAAKALSPTPRNPMSDRLVWPSLAASQAMLRGTTPYAACQFLAACLPIAACKSLLPHASLLQHASFLPHACPLQRAKVCCTSVAPCQPVAACHTQKAHVAFFQLVRKRPLFRPGENEHALPAG
eukprot:364146-Chlamydomonas_euryale.AAC.5